MIAICVSVSSAWPARVPRWPKRIAERKAQAEVFSLAKGQSKVREWPCKPWSFGQDQEIAPTGVQALAFYVPVQQKDSMRMIPSIRAHDQTMDFDQNPLFDPNSLYIIIIHFSANKSGD
jgi:hypothetical protein